MNLQAWMALVGTLAIQGLGIAFIYGQLTQKVKGHEHTLLRHDGELEDHSQTLMDHEGRIARIEGRLGIERD